jgi:hypothetical protein
MRQTHVRAREDRPVQKTGRPERAIGPDDNIGGSDGIESEEALDREALI